LGRAEPAAAVGAVLGAVLIDLDHLVDWGLNGWRDDFSRRIVVPLHGWEYPCLLAALALMPRFPAAARQAAAGLAAGWLGHLTLDVLVNRPETPAAYSLLRRMRHGFARVPSGWLPSPAWQARYRTTHRTARVETMLASTLALAVLVATRPTRPRDQAR
jgi:hypothetical protein